MEIIETWSSLPIILLWMIMDRLHFVDRDRLGFVCKDWKLAPQSYRPPQPPPCGSISPWVIHRLRRDGVFIIFNPLTMKTFTLGGGVLDGALPILFSKQGWLLFQEGVEDHVHLYFFTLLNIHTNARINLVPPYDDSYPSSLASPQYVPASMASFSTLDDGTPNTLVLAVASSSGPTNFFLADIKTKTWTEHAVGGSALVNSSLIVGHKLYALDINGILFIYDILTRQWTDVASNGLQYALRQVLAESVNGEILKIGPTYRGRPSFSISKLNAAQTGWEEILHHDQPSFFNSIFLRIYGNHSFATNQEEAGGSKGIKVYEFYCDSSDCISATFVVHDLMNATLQPITHPLYSNGYEITWIDLGSMEKVPPSCLHYDPGQS